MRQETTDIELIAYYLVTAISTPSSKMYFPLSLLLPLAFAATPYLNTTSPIPLSHHTSISQTLAKWPVAIDSKNYTLLSEVFTPNATLDIKLPTGPIYGLAAIKNWVNLSLNGTLMQHDLGTQHISIFGNTAYATTYFVTTVFHPMENNISTVEDNTKYQDTLMRGEQ